MGRSWLGKGSEAATWLKIERTRRFIEGCWLAIPAVWCACMNIGQSSKICWIVYWILQCVQNGGRAWESKWPCVGWVRLRQRWLSDTTWFRVNVAVDDHTYSNMCSYHMWRTAEWYKTFELPLVLLWNIPYNVYLNFFFQIIPIFPTNFVNYF